MAAAIFLGGNAFFGRLWAGGGASHVGQDGGGREEPEGISARRRAAARSGEMKERIGLWREAAAPLFALDDRVEAVGDGRGAFKNNRSISRGAVMAADLDVSDAKYTRQSLRSIKHATLSITDSAQ